MQDYGLLTTLPAFYLNAHIKISFDKRKKYIYIYIIIINGHVFDIKHVRTVMQDPNNSNICGYYPK